MWKFQIRLAILGMLIQLFLFSLNLIHNGHFNVMVFVMAIGWTIWSSYCYYKIKTEKK